MNSENTTSIHLFDDLPSEILTNIFEHLDLETCVELGRHKEGGVSKKFELILNTKSVWLPFFKKEEHNFVKRPRQVLINVFQETAIKYIDNHPKDMTVKEYIQSIRAIKLSTLLIHPDAQKARQKIESIIDSTNLSPERKKESLMFAASGSLASALLVITWPVCHKILANIPSDTQKSDIEIKRTWLALPDTIRFLSNLSKKYLIVFGWMIDDPKLRQVWIEHPRAIFCMREVAVAHLEAFRWMIDDPKLRQVWIEHPRAIFCMREVAVAHLEAFRWMMDDLKLRQVWIEHPKAIFCMCEVAVAHLEAFRWMIDDPKLRQVWIEHPRAIFCMREVAVAHLEAFRWMMDDLKLRQVWIEHPLAIYRMREVAVAHQINIPVDANKEGILSALLQAINQRIPRQSQEGSIKASVR